MSEKTLSEEQKTMDKVLNITLYFVHCRYVLCSSNYCFFILYAF